MGCDIHWHVETRYIGDAWGDEEHGWEYNRCLSIETDPHRDYTLFGLLAGVRGGDDPVYPPRGMPEDSQIDMGEDVHTPSWLTPEELIDVLHAFTVDIQDYDSASYLWQRFYILRELREHEVRVVFWFDS